MEMPMKNVHDFCGGILALDKVIRFVGIADVKAQVVETKYREDVTPMLSEKEAKTSILQSAIRMGTRSMYEEQLGETVYAFTMYKKVKSHYTDKKRV